MSKPDRDRLDKMTAACIPWACSLQERNMQLHAKDLEALEDTAVEQAAAEGIADLAVNLALAVLQEVDSACQ